MIDDLEVTKALLNAVKNYGKKRQWSLWKGLLGFQSGQGGASCRGFDEMNTMITHYNYPYYAPHGATGHEKISAMGRI